MKKYYLYIILSIYSCITFSQYQWNNKYSFGYPVANSQGVVYNPNTNDFVVSGVRSNINGNGGYSYIQSITQQGIETKMNVFNETDSLTYIFDQGGLNYFNNYYYGSGTLYIAGDNQEKGFIVKYNANLDTVFSKIYPGNTSTMAFLARNSQATDDTIYIVGSLGISPNGSLIDIDGLFIIADSNGNELKRVRYGVGYFMESIEDIKKAGNNWICTGYKRRYVSNQLEYYAFFLLYDSNGNLLKSYSPSELTYGSCCTATKDGGYAMCGGRISYEPWGPSNSTWTIYKGYIEKVNANMQREWMLTLSKIDTTFQTELKKIIENPDGTLVAAGTDADAFDHKHISGWIVKVSATGQVLWNRYHKVINTSQDEHFFNDMCKAPDGGYALAGVALDYSGEEPVGTYAWVCKTDSFGCLVPGCQLVGIAENSPLESSFKLYPNPASDRLFLYYNNPQLQKCVFSVRDLAGRQLVPPTPLENSTTYEMRIGDWAKGLYFVEVRDAEGRVFTEKFVKE